jgi:hypothetical protein
VSAPACPSAHRGGEGPPLRRAARSYRDRDRRLQRFGVGACRRAVRARCPCGIHLGEPLGPRPGICADRDERQYGCGIVVTGSGARLLKLEKPEHANKNPLRRGACVADEPAPSRPGRSRRRPSRMRARSRKHAHPHPRRGTGRRTVVGALEPHPRRPRPPPPPRRLERGGARRARRRHRPRPGPPGRDPAARPDRPVRPGLQRLTPARRHSTAMWSRRSRCTPR